MARAGPRGAGECAGRAALRGPGHVRAAAPAGRRRRAEVAVAGSRSTPGVSYRPGARFGQAPSARRPGCCAPTTRRWTSRRSTSRRSSTPVTCRQSVRHRGGHRARSRPRPRAARTQRRGWSRSAATTPSRCRCCGPSPPSTGRSRWCTSTPTSTPGTPTSARRTPTARRSAGPSRRACSPRAALPRRHPRAAVRPAATSSTTATLGFAIVIADRRRPTRASTGSSSGSRERGRRPAGLRVGRHRRARPRVRAGHRYAGDGRADHAASCWRSCAGCDGLQHRRRRRRRGRARLRPRRDHRHRRRHVAYELTRPRRAPGGPTCRADVASGTA